MEKRFLVYMAMGLSLTSLTMGVEAAVESQSNQPNQFNQANQSNQNNNSSNKSAFDPANSASFNRPRTGVDISTRQEKDELLRRDQIDTTDTLAIPFDDSEVEDEEAINRDEKREVFPLPHSR